MSIELKVRKDVHYILCYDCVQLGESGVPADHTILTVDVVSDLLNIDIGLRHTSNTTHKDGTICSNDENIIKGTILINTFSESDNEYELRLKQEQALELAKMLQFAIDNMEKAWEA